MKLEITTGAYWFYRGGFDMGRMDMEVLLQDDVDGAALQEAALRTMERYPFLRLVPERSEDGTRYLLTETDRPFRIVRSPGFVSLESPKANGYLWSLGYDGARLYLRVFHGLSDGTGLISVMKAILRFYFSAAEGDPLPEEPSDAGRTYADPFGYARAWEHDFVFRVPEEAYLPELENEYVPYHERFILSLKQVLYVSEHTESSVSGILALLLARALGRMSGDPSRSVVVKCPIDLRRMLGCTETMQNCVSSIRYVYSPKLAGMPFPRQASCFKGMLMIQSSEEFLMNSFLGWKQEVLRFNRGSSIEEKREQLKAPAITPPLLSYLGQFTVGEYDEKIRSAKVTADVGGGMGAVALCLGDRLYLDLLLTDRKKNVARALAGELDGLGISRLME